MGAIDTDLQEIESQLKELLKKPISKNQANQLKSLISSLINEINSDETNNPVKSKDYSVFIKLLEENYSKFYCINEYSQLLKISARQLNKIVKSNSGRTTCELVSNKMISEAKKSLTESNLSIKEIAFNLGFVDQYYFSRYFKKYTGLSPKNYKVSNASMSIKM
jgi:AraC family transcriptional regulator, transcriptional activator of pobA